jgi:hypothetical protein
MAALAAYLGVGRTERATLMRTVVELPPEPHVNLRTYRGYRLEVRDCFYCWRDLHVYVPETDLLSEVVIGVPCPHCRKWEAETRIPLHGQSVYVSACQRSWVGWRIRDAERTLATARAYARIWFTWPYWALYRLKLRWGSRSQGRR